MAVVAVFKVVSAARELTTSCRATMNATCQKLHTESHFGVELIRWECNKKVYIASSTSSAIS